MHILNMKSLLKIAAVLMSTVAFGEEPSPACNVVAPKRIVAPQPMKPSDRLRQDITLHCGSAIANQSVGERSTSHNSEEKNGRSIAWDKLIDAISKLLSSVLWPLLGAFVAYLLRKELAALLSRLKRGKWGSAEFEFENYVREVDAAAEIPRTVEGERVSATATDRASNDPRGAILSSWIEVEDNLSSLVERRGLNKNSSNRSRPSSPISAIREVQRAEVLDASYVALFHDLRVMRNEAAHSNEFSPSPSAVLKYIRLAKELATAMRSASQTGEPFSEFTVR